MQVQGKGEEKRMGRDREREGEMMVVEFSLNSTTHFDMGAMFLHCGNYNSLMIICVLCN